MWSACCLEIGNYFRVYEKKKKAVERLEEQLTKLEVQATDKVCTSNIYQSSV